MGKLFVLGIDFKIYKPNKLKSLRVMKRDLIVNMEKV